MNEDLNTTNAGRDDNPDLITGEPGSHPIATGIGAAGAGATGAAIGTAVAGPVGTVVGAAIGAIVGGLGGKAVGEAIDPTGEDDHWRATHESQPYARDNEAGFDAYAPAYRTGYEGYPLDSDSPQTFEEAEPDLRSKYQETNPTLAWDKAREATRAAWTRVKNGEAVRSPKN